MTGSCYKFVCNIAKLCCRMSIVAELLTMTIVYHQYSDIIAYMTVSHRVQIVEESEVSNEAIIYSVWVNQRCTYHGRYRSVDSESSNIAIASDTAVGLKEVPCTK